MNKQKKYIGAHVSIAGGIVNAPGRAATEGLNFFQCFTRSPQGGPAPEITPVIVEIFTAEMKKYGIAGFVIHAPYYINFASLNNRIRHGSVSVVRQELERGSMLGAQFVMAHIGSYAEQTLSAGMSAAIEGLKKVLDGYTGSTEFLIEISAGAGSVLGATFAEVGEMVTALKKLRGFGGICFDTCHAFASGYDFRTTEGTQKVLAEFDEKIGLQYLRLTHVNDSKADLGGKKDRHEHIDKGYIGYEGLENLLTSKPFMAIPWILETESEGRPADVTALKKMA